MTKRESGRDDKREDDDIDDEEENTMQRQTSRYYDVVLSTLHELSHLFIIKILRGQYSSHFYFIDRETYSQRI